MYGAHFVSVLLPAYLSSSKNSLISFICCSLIISAFIFRSEIIPLSFSKLLCEYAWQRGLKSVQKYKLQTHEAIEITAVQNDLRRLLLYLLKPLQYHFMWYLIEPILTKHSIDIKMIIRGFIELTITNHWDNLQQNPTINVSMYTGACRHGELACISICSSNTMNLSAYGQSLI
jgi:hypothetical protein